MSFNELNSVEHYIVSKLSGVNLNAPDSTSATVKEDGATYGSFPWQYRSAAELNRPADQVLLEGELREALDPDQSRDRHPFSLKRLWWLTRL